MALNKGFNDEIKALSSEPVQGVNAGDLGTTVLAAQGKNLDQPLRMYASSPADAFVNFSASVTTAGDGGFKQLPPISSIGVPLIAATKINMGTGAVTGATVTINGTSFATAFALLTKTNGQWRRFGFAIQAAGTITAAASVEASTQALLSDYGILVAGLGGTPIGYLDVQWVTTATQYKTPTAGTNVVDNSGIYRLPFGGGGSGSGSGNTVLETLKNTLDASSPYSACMANTILADGVTKFSVVTGAALDLTTNTVKFTANGQQVVSTQSLDSYYLANSPSDITTIDLEAFWSYGTSTSSFAVPTGFTYEVSRDGGQNYFPVSMTQLSGSNTFYGTLTFGQTATLEGSSATLATQASTGTTLALNTTTQQNIGQAFTVTSVVKALTVSLNVVKTGTPSGNLFVSVVNNSGGVPSLLSSDILNQSFAIQMANLATGAVSITIPGVVLSAGTYHIVLTTDSAYQASFVAGTTQLALSALSSGAAAPFATTYNGTSYSATAVDLTYSVLGRALDLRVRITAAGSPTYPVGLDGYGVFYGYQDQGFSTAKKKSATRTFNSVTDNTSVFTLTEFNPDIDLLRVYLVGSGQVFSNGDFTLAGQTVTFPANTFNMGGVSQTVTLRFDQNTGGSFDGADSNARLLATSHLGSTSATDDRSVAGRGVILRGGSGTLFELAIDTDGLPIILSVP